MRILYRCRGVALADMGEGYAVLKQGQVYLDAIETPREAVIAFLTDAYDEEGPPGHGEYPPHLVGPVHRVRLRDEPRERDGQPRRGQREEDAVDIVGHEEVRVALVAEDVAEGYLVDGAEYLHNHDAEGEYRRAVEVILLSGFAQAAFLLSVDRQLLTLH